VSDTASSTTYTASTQTDNETVESTSDTAATVAASTQQTDAAAEYTANTTGKIDTTDLFSKRDLEQSPDVSDAKTITAADGKTETITEEGVYVITGSAKNFTIKVEADKEAKVQLVLDGVNITNDSFPVVYVVSADKCFITTTDSENTLSVTGTFTSDGDTNTDAVIYSKDDLVFNGTGTLTISSENGNGISGKDDIKVTGGTYHITSALDSIEANDSIAIYDGTFEITSSKDGLHSENSEDDTKGWIYIYNGTFNITAASDAVQGTTIVQIDGGSFTLQAAEGIEATYVQINDGTIQITASDDGINASQKSSSYSTPTIEFNGGTTTIVMGQGDTDAVDANGNIYVNGGTIDITAQVSSFDYDGTAEYNGGTIIINGSQVDSIPQSMMGGGMGRMGNMGGNRMGR
ncbi:MAG: carbohydrate-binding domain-containing protein, partial [Clostridia bacterium]|nr:carbohydrate-binding domain-containing protein [Clostridia bacterium]